MLQVRRSGSYANPRFLCLTNSECVPELPFDPAGIRFFCLDVIVAILDALKALERAGKRPADFLIRHQCGDWGDLSEEDRSENEIFFSRHFRIFSTYHLDEDVKIWVITEADQSATTLLLPSEY